MRQDEKEEKLDRWTYGSTYSTRRGYFGDHASLFFLNYDRHFNHLNVDNMERKRNLTSSAP